MLKILDLELSMLKFKSQICQLLMIWHEQKCLTHINLNLLIWKMGGINYQHTGSTLLVKCGTFCKVLDTKSSQKMLTKVIGMGGGLYI